MEIGIHGETSAFFLSLARRTDIRSDTDSDTDMEVRNLGPGNQHHNPTLHHNVTRLHGNKYTSAHK